MLPKPETTLLIDWLFLAADSSPTATTDQRIARELSIILADLLNGSLPVDRLTVDAAERLTEALRAKVARNQVLEGTVDHRGYTIA